MFNRFIKYAPIVWILINVFLFFTLQGYGGFKFPLIHTIVLSFIPVIVLNTIYRCLHQLNTLCATTTTFISFEIFNGIRRFKCRRNVIPIFIVYCFYAYCIYNLGFIPSNPLGVFGAILASVALLSGLSGYCLYIHFIYTIYYISSHYDYFNQAYPKHQNWYIQTYNMYKTLSNTFLFCGILYILEYCMLVINRAPIAINEIITLNLDNILLYISWISIFLLIVIAFPILTHIGTNLFNDLCNKWVDNKIQRLDADILDKLQNTDHSIIIHDLNRNFKINSYCIKFYKTLYLKNKGVPCMTLLSIITNFCITLGTIVNLFLDILSKSPN